MHWAYKNESSMAAWLAITFGDMVGDQLERLRGSEEQAARRYGCRLRHFRDLLYSGNNMKLSTLARILRASGMAASIVVYVAGDQPIIPDMFIECWKRLGKPTSMFQLENFPEDLEKKYKLAKDALVDIGDNLLPGCQTEGCACCDPNSYDGQCDVGIARAALREMGEWSVEDTDA